MHRRRSRSPSSVLAAALLVPTALLATTALLAACAEPASSSCGPGEVIRTSEREACVYEAAIVIESGFSCPPFVPSLVMLGDLAVCVPDAPSAPTPVEREQLCRLTGARCDATPDTPRRASTTGTECTLRDVPPGGLDSNEILLETLHDECVDALGVTTGCIDDGRDDEPAFCTCRCDAPEGSDVPTCACPSGTTCEPIFESGELGGGYCVRT